MILNQLTSNRRLRKLLGALGPDYTVLDLHREQFLRKRSDAGFAARFTRLVARTHATPFLGTVVLRAILMYGSIAEGGWELLALRKPGVASR